MTKRTKNDLHVRWGLDGCACPPGDAPVPDVPSIIQWAHRRSGWRGAVYPLMRVHGDLVWPVIEIDPHVCEARVREGDWPERDQSNLHIWESLAPGLGPAPALRIVGFNSTGPSREMRSLHQFGGYGAGMWVCVGPERPREATLFECDYWGICVVHAPGGSTQDLYAKGGAPELLVKGRPGPVETAIRTTSTRWMEELLFAYYLAVYDGIPASRQVKTVISTRTGRKLTNPSTVRQKGTADKQEL